jgi:hypothetical protein
MPAVWASAARELLGHYTCLDYVSLHLIFSELSTNLCGKGFTLLEVVNIIPILWIFFFKGRIFEQKEDFYRYPNKLM